MGTFGHVGRSFTYFYALLLDFHEYLCIFAESRWKFQKNSENYTENYGFYIKRQKKRLKVRKKRQGTPKMAKLASKVSPAMPK